MYKPLGIELKNKFTGEICEVYISTAGCRWSSPGDYLLRHVTEDYIISWSFLCSENGFRRVINYGEWRYYHGN